MISMSRSSSFAIEPMVLAIRSVSVATWFEISTAAVLIAYLFGPALGRLVQTGLASLM